MHWQGEFAFGDAWLVYRGASADNRCHSHAAVQLVAAADALTVIDDAGQAFTSCGWAIRSGVRHRLEPSAALTLLLADPQSRLAAAVLALLPRAPMAPLPPALVATLAAASPLADLPALLARQLPLGVGFVDPRLAAALAYLDHHAGGNAVAAAAEHGGLSPSRLRALAQAQFGVPMSKLLLWKKVRKAGLAMAGGASLVDAALAAGFADQAHLTRTMTEVVGLTPGEARTAASG
ncbi:MULTISPECIES: helix-turn-helix domain-containing protein [unclassified Roseateles]|uniref:helix-turn-helix transcriptional regulator n=1 Tax=unclassified Roseateles TaxID=2626991 RepID=UPI0007007C27|nr:MULTISPECIES: helix-turn-helix domain-containing protein [unclassified Roseateles]KQW46569.1 hypothetical protein ASC81_09245 [Pelomonas sp. Root405]KRA73620.1 hypothetical protein ASD88_09245 [Pelomonas sp. Root662]